MKMTMYEISRICSSYIHYHSDQYGPTAISIEEMSKFVFAFETGWGLESLMEAINDLYND